jgi:hypothetical protein
MSVGKKESIMCIWIQLLRIPFYTPESRRHQGSSERDTSSLEVSLQGFGKAGLDMRDMKAVRLYCRNMYSLQTRTLYYTKAELITWQDNLVNCTRRNPRLSMITIACKFNACMVQCESVDRKDREKIKTYSIYFVLDTRDNSKNNSSSTGQSTYKSEQQEGATDTDKKLPF